MKRTTKNMAGTLGIYLGFYMCLRVLMSKKEELAWSQPLDRNNQFLDTPVPLTLTLICML